MCTTQKVAYCEQQEQTALVVIKPKNYSRCSSNAKETLPTKHGEGFIVKKKFIRLIIFSLIYEKKIKKDL